MSKFSIKTKKFISSDNIELLSLLKLVELGSAYPNSESLIIKLKEYEKNNELEKFFKCLELEPILLFRLLTKYKLTGYQALNIFMEQNAAFGDELDFNSLSNNSVEFSTFFKGRISALLVFYEINLASQIAKSLNEFDDNPIENSQMLSQLYYLFVYLLALYKPEIYSTLMIKDNYGFEDLQVLIKNSLDKSLGNLSSDLKEIFKIDDSLIELTNFISNSPWNRKRWGSIEPVKAKKLSTINYIGLVLAREIMQHTGIQGLQSTIRSLKRYSGIPQTKIMDAVGDLPKHVKHIQQTFNLKAYKLPEYIQWFENNYFETETEDNNLILLPDFIEELKISIFEFGNGNELALNEAIWVTLKAILICFNFQRACYFSVNEEQLKLETCLGTRLFDYEQTEYKIDDDDSLLSLTTRNLSLTTNSKELFRDGFPYFAFPIVYNGVCQGVFYADKAKRPNSLEIKNNEKKELNKLSKCWNI